MRIKYVYKCCIPQCKNIESKNLLRFFNLNYFDINSKWIEIILSNLTNYNAQEKNKVYKICAEHFSDEDYDLVWDQTNGNGVNDGNNKVLRKTLKSTAIPDNYKIVDLDTLSLGKEITLLRLNKSMKICDSNYAPNLKEIKNDRPNSSNQNLNLLSDNNTAVLESISAEIEVHNDKKKYQNENDCSSDTDIEIIENTNLISSSLKSINIINPDANDKTQESNNRKIVHQMEILFNPKHTEEKLNAEIVEIENPVLLQANKENSVLLQANKENSKTYSIGNVYSLNLKKLNIICHYCNLHFKNLINFKEHFENNHLVENEIESSCNSNAMKTRKDKFAGIYSTLNETFLICTYCKARLINDMEIVQHLEKHRSLISKDKSTLANKNIVPAKTTTAKNSNKDDQVKNQKNKKSDKQINRRPKKLSCTYCPKMFPCNFTLNNHIRTHTKERPFKCPDTNCSKSFSTLFILENHKRIHTGERPYKCDKCDFKFLRRSNLSAHFKAIHSNIKKFKCPDCEKAFPLKDRLNRHRMSHSGIKNFKCSVCDAAFYRLEHKQRHESRHSREPYLSCKYPNCTEMFSLKSQRIMHEKTVHPNDEIKFKCPKCNKIFENNYEREKHKIQDHPELAKNSCKFCGKNFITSYVLRNHLKICEKKSLNISMTKGKNENENESKNIFKCSYKKCTKTFLNDTNLRKHEIIHAIKGDENCIKKY